MLYSRRAKSFNSQFRDIANALNYLPDETVIDGEVVAIDENGRPNFNLLQNFRSTGANIQYFAFDSRERIICDTRSSSVCVMIRIHATWCERRDAPAVTYGQIVTTAISAEARFDSRRRAWKRALA